MRQQSSDRIFVSQSYFFALEEEDVDDFRRGAGETPR